MIRQPAHVEARRPPLRGICLVVKEKRPTDHPKPVVPVGMTAKFPRRPDSGVLSESIPLFFIARNRAGLWVAREAEGHTGGIFLFKGIGRTLCRKKQRPTRMRDHVSRRAF